MTAAWGKRQGRRRAETHTQRTHALVLFERLLARREPVDAVERAVDEEKVDGAEAAKVRSRHATHRNTMRTNLDLLEAF